MEPEQLQHLLEGLTGAVQGLAGHNNAGRFRLDPLESTKPDDWLAWKDHFRIACTINTWGHQRARREIKGAMRGDALRITSDIPIEDGAAAADPEQLLTVYEGRFVTQAATSEARRAYYVATQKPGEDVLAWHARLRSTFLRAFPGIGDYNNDVRLVEHYIAGLHDRSLRRMVIEADPQTFAAALEEASRKAAARSAEKSMSLLIKTKTEPGTTAHIAQMEAATGLCYNCGFSGHFQHECHIGRKCHSCGEKGHLRKDCPATSSASGRSFSRFAFGGDRNPAPYRGGAARGRHHAGRPSAGAAARGRPFQQSRGRGGNSGGGRFQLRTAVGSLQEQLSALIAATTEEEDDDQARDPTADEDNSSCYYSYDGQDDAAAGQEDERAADGEKAEN